VLEYQSALATVGISVGVDDVAGLHAAKSNSKSSTINRPRCIAGSFVYQKRISPNSSIAEPIVRLDNKTRPLRIYV